MRKRRPYRLLLIGAAIISMAALTRCSTASDPVQTQKDLALALQYLQAAGCITAQVATAAAPIVAVTADDKGNKALSVIAMGGAIACRLTAPAAIVSAPGTTLGAAVVP